MIRKAALVLTMLLSLLPGQAFAQDEVRDRDTAPTTGDVAIRSQRGETESGEVAVRNRGSAETGDVAVRDRAGESGGVAVRNRQGGGSSGDVQIRDRIPAGPGLLIIPGRDQNGVSGDVVIRNRTGRSEIDFVPQSRKRPTRRIYTGRRPAHRDTIRIIKQSGISITAFRDLSKRVTNLEGAMNKNNIADREERKAIWREIGHIKTKQAELEGKLSGREKPKEESRRSEDEDGTGILASIGKFFADYWVWILLAVIALILGGLLYNWWQNRPASTPRPRSSSRRVTRRELAMTGQPAGIEHYELTDGNKKTMVFENTSTSPVPTDRIRFTARNFESTAVLGSVNVLLNGSVMSGGSGRNPREFFGCDNALNLMQVVDSLGAPMTLDPGEKIEIEYRDGG